eukprot:gnl/Hemi2/22870_TR7656_c0_g1_i1.p1 gnl/Hemi2/22870_TR7656_c0_g1~~gnl/Hemi2/22870_TR7656_c0_g1_i1.p1  ORF type:complete len:828 (-),score=243.45 gnl/Hemi2/22870_TR7656_c0_g1_i1:183-2426(-)
MDASWLDEHATFPPSRPYDVVMNGSFLAPSNATDDTALILSVPLVRAGVLCELPPVVVRLRAYVAPPGDDDPLWRQRAASLGVSDGTTVLGFTRGNYSGRALGYAFAARDGAQSLDGITYGRPGGYLEDVPGWFEVLIRLGSSVTVMGRAESIDVQPAFLAAPQTVQCGRDLQLVLYGGGQPSVFFLEASVRLAGHQQDFLPAEALVTGATHAHIYGTARFVPEDSSVVFGPGGPAFAGGASSLQSSLKSFNEIVSIPIAYPAGPFAVLADLFLLPTGLEHLPPVTPQVTFTYSAPFPDGHIEYTRVSDGSENVVPPLAFRLGFSSGSWVVGFAIEDGTPSFFTGTVNASQPSPSPSADTSAPVPWLRPAVVVVEELPYRITDPILCTDGVKGVIEVSFHRGAAGGMYMSVSACGNSSMTHSFDPQFMDPTQPLKFVLYEYGAENDFNYIIRGLHYEVITPYFEKTSQGSNLLARFFPHTELYAANRTTPGFVTSTALLPTPSRCEIATQPLPTYTTSQLSPGQAVALNAFDGLPVLPVALISAPVARPLELTPRFPYHAKVVFTVERPYQGYKLFLGLSDNVTTLGVIWNTKIGLNCGGFFFIQQDPDKATAGRAAGVGHEAPYFKKHMEAPSQGVIEVGVALGRDSTRLSCRIGAGPIRVWSTPLTLSFARGIDATVMTDPTAADVFSVYSIDVYTAKEGRYCAADCHHDQGRGTCVDGSCACEPGFAGRNCHVSPITHPSVLLP